MPGIEDIIFKPGDAEVRLTTELERFSFGVAVSPLAEVTPLEGPDNFVRTVVTLGGISLDHAQHPETRQQNITLAGEEISERIAGLPFIFDTGGQFLMMGAGPPLPQEIVSDVADGVQKLNDTFEAQS